MKSFEELSPSEKKAFATDTLYVNGDVMHHQRLGISISFADFERCHEWHRAQPQGIRRFIPPYLR